MDKQSAAPVPTDAQLDEIAAVLVDASRRIEATDSEAVPA
jgi:hypothetical protein